VFNPLLNPAFAIVVRCNRTALVVPERPTSLGLTRVFKWSALKRWYALTGGGKGEWANTGTGRIACPNNELATKLRIKSFWDIFTLAAAPLVKLIMRLRRVAYNA
jgi:hypothetical protein